MAVDLSMKQRSYFESGTAVLHFPEKMSADNSLHDWFQNKRDTISPEIGYNL